MSDRNSFFLGYILSICCPTHIKGLVEGEEVLPNHQKHFSKINALSKEKK